MINVLRSIVFTIMALFTLAACSGGPARSFSVGDQLKQFDFSEPATFEEGVYPNATLRITDGVYRIALSRGDNEIWWAQWGDTWDDVVIDVVVEQISEANENAYGIACRMRGNVGQEIAVDPTLAAIATGVPAEATAEVDAAAPAEATGEADTDPEAESTAEATVEATEAADPGSEADSEAADTEETGEELQPANGDGYLFLIQGSGSYTILRARGRNITPLVNWTASDLVNRGPGRNQLRAVCLGDYLALYINGEFAADATDSTYTSGQVGLAASAANRLGVQVEFDDLVVHEAVSG